MSPVVAVAKATIREASRKKLVVALGCALLTILFTLRRSFRLAASTPWLHPAFVAIAAAVTGWVIAESNALRTRLAQWPIFKSYIDWKKVEEDLRG